MNFLQKRSKLPPPHEGRSWAQDKSTRAARQRFLEKNQNGGRRFTPNWLECLGWRSLNKFIGSLRVFGFSWGQSYLATLVTPENCTKILRNLTFVVQFAYFSIRQRKVLFLGATFEQLPLQKATFDQRFEELRETFWKLSSNLWKALKRPVSNY